MPQPGSAEYDKHRARIRKELVDQGLSDDDADRLSKERASGDQADRGADEVPDRALGPKSER